MIIVVFSTLLGTWFSYLVSILSERLVVWPAAVIFLAGSTLALAKAKYKKPKPIYALTLIFWGAFLIKLFSQMMFVDGQGIWAGGSNVWGDWAGHMGYVANWIYGSNFPAVNPWYAGIKLSYPFMFDFTSALLVKFGATPAWSFQLPGIVFGLGIIVLLFKLTKKLTKSSAAASISVLLFMFSGGLGFFWFDKLRELTHSYELNIQWVNFVISEMVPQRGILIGIPAALSVFLLWLKGFKTKDKKIFLLSGLLAGMIPFFHAHTFLVVAAVAGFYFLVKPNKLWLYFLLPASALALPQYLYFLPQVTGYTSGFIRWQPGWAAHVQGDNWLWFWFKNAGVMAILIPIAWISSYKHDKKLFSLYIPFAIIFIATNLIVFQPWENDNSKLLRFWYLASSILVANFIVQNAKTNPKKLLASLLIVLATFSGGYDALSWLNFEKNKLLMWGNLDIQAAESIKSLTPKDSIFLTTDSHNHWVVDLAGRKIVLGFRGWLWSWGIDYGDREQDVFKMFRGDPETSNLLKKYSVDYVIIGPGEKSTFKANEKYFSDNYEVLLENEREKIFKVN